MVVAAYALPAAQRSSYPGLQGRLMRPQPLVAEEIAELLQASREALAYKSLRLSRSPTGTPGAEYLIGPDGRPVMIRAASDRPDWRAFTPGPRLEFQRDGDHHHQLHAARGAALRRRAQRRRDGD